ncbi:MAG: PH domain-containing protein [Thermoplasmata archaeon]|nr:PH domain-containing protein [Thermoplasmata archaeon]
MQVYEDNLKIGITFKAIYIILIGINVILPAWLLFIGEITGTVLIFTTILLSIALVYAVTPKKYIILNNGLKIVCGVVKINIPLDDIESIETRPSWHTYGSFEALRFGTGTGENCILIKRKRGSNILIQPSDTGKFMKILKQIIDKKL